MFEFVSIVVAAVVLIGIGFPRLYTPDTSKRKKSVGSSYWGLYEGAGPDRTDESKIQCPSPSRKWNVIAGSANYATGKGLAKSNRLQDIGLQDVGLQDIGMRDIRRQSYRAD